MKLITEIKTKKGNMFKVYQWASTFRACLTTPDGFTLKDIIPLGTSIEAWQHINNELKKVV